MFQQHQDESLYDAWTHFKDLIQRVPHHVLNLWSLTQFFYGHVDRYIKIDINYVAGGNLRRLSTKEAWETIEDCVQCDKQWKTLTSTISNQTIANLKAQLVKNEVVRVMIPKCMSWLDAYDEPIGDMDIRKILSVDESEPQLLPNFSPLDVNLGGKRGTDASINPYSPDSFRMKVVKPLTSHTPPSPQVAYFHRNGVYL
ncbi:hypothetical protein Tco_0855369 [Tanacetum coccineum]